MKTGTIKHTAALLALTTAALFSSCAPKSQSNDSSYSSDLTSNSNIVGGQISTVDFQKQNGIVQVQLVLKSGGALCTGSLIARNIVLTAAHCLADPDLQQIAVVFALDQKSTTQADVVYGTDGDVNADFAPTDDPASTAAWNDVALIKLEKDAPADFQLAKLPAVGQAVDLHQGSTVTLAGFGITNPIINKEVNGQVVSLPGKGAGTLRQISGILVTGVTADQKEIHLDQSNQKGACHGDSGGPAYLQQADGSLLLVGITSRGTDPLGNCQAGAIYTDTVGQLEWITSHAQALIAKASSTPSQGASSSSSGSGSTSSSGSSSGKGKGHRGSSKKH